jgi:Zn-dependent protease
VGDGGPPWWRLRASFEPLLAALFALWVRIVPFNAISASFFGAMIVNVGLFVFNMIPFPPLDGSRLLYAVAPEVRDIMDKQRAGFVLLFC